MNRELIRNLICQLKEYLWLILKTKKNYKNLKKHYKIGAILGTVGIAVGEIDYLRNESEMCSKEKLNTNA